MSNDTTLPSPWEQQRLAMGAVIRHQRELANMTLRQLAEVTKVSNAYLSQLERGHHDPTVRVLLQIGEALDLTLEEMLQKAGETKADAVSVETAIVADSILSTSEKKSLLSVYRSYVAGHAAK